MNRLGGLELRGGARRCKNGSKKFKKCFFPPQCVLYMSAEANKGQSFPPLTERDNNIMYH